MTELALQAHADGTIVPVRAQPGARRAGITGVHAGALKVAVAEPPEKGKANEAIAAVLASSIGCRPAQVTLLSGPTSRQKKFLIRGIALEQVVRSFTASLSGPRRAEAPPGTSS